MSTRLAGAAAIVAAVLLLAACGAASVPVPSTTATTGASTPSAVPGSSTSTSEAAVSTPGAASSAGAPYLWPFADAAAAAAWTKAHTAAAVDDWHLDAVQTAQRFARDFLGYTELDKVTSQDVQATEALVGVGSAGDGSVFTAGVVHLTRPDATSPWAVVGTKGGDLTITSPSPGAAAAIAPATALAVAGVITGVDESLHLQVRTVAGGVVGDVAGIGAGGDKAPWTASVPLTAAATGTVTVSVSTGGHLQRVEKFAVTGVHAS